MESPTVTLANKLERLTDTLIEIEDAGRRQIAEKLREIAEYVDSW
jgi:hypothetical protein